MKYVIWGSGIRGKRVLALLGKENVVAFVDADADKAGQQYEGVMIYDTGVVDHQFEDCVYVITPYGYEDEIMQSLKNKGIDRCIRMGNFRKNTERESFFEGYLWDVPKDECALYGINLLHIMLYDLFREKYVENVYLVPDGSESKGLIDLLSKEYTVAALENLPAKIRLITKTMEERILLKSFINAEPLAALLIRGRPVLNAELSKFKDIHKGQRCFIIATGPSLRVEDLDKLKENHELTMSMNRIFNIFSKTEWRPDYYVMQDAKMIEDLTNEVAELQLPNKFISHNPGSYWENPLAAASSIQFNLISEKYTDTLPNFSVDICRGIFEGYTVTYACLQIAVYMGFSEIYLLGVDFNYSSDLYSANNHFPGYQNDGKQVRLNTVRPDLVALAYEKARIYGEERGVKIYNATRGGKLEIFQRVDFDKLFEN